MLAVSGTGWILAPYFKAGAAVWFMAGVLYAVRLLATGYAYSIFRDADSGVADLVIAELRFGKSKTVCRVSLFDVKEMRVYDPVADVYRARSEGKRRIKRSKRPRPDRKAYPSAKGYNYCVDVFPAKYCLIRISGDETEYVKFMPDRVIINAIDDHSIR